MIGDIGYGSRMYEMLEDLAEVADYTPKTDSAVYDDAINRYVQALNTVAAHRTQAKLSAAAEAHTEFVRRERKTALALAAEVRRHARKRPRYQGRVTTRKVKVA